MLTYSTLSLGFDRDTVLDCLAVVAIVQLITQLGAAQLARRFGDLPVLLVTSSLGIAAPYAMFLLANNETRLGLITGVSLATICGSGFYAVVAGYTSRLFDARIRYTAMSAAYQLGGATFGGFTPMVAVVITQHFPKQWLPLALLYSALALTSFLGVVFLSRGSRRSSVRLVPMIDPVDAVATMHSPDTGGYEAGQIGTPSRAPNPRFWIR
jgi:MFS family permease